MAARGQRPLGEPRAPKLREAARRFGRWAAWGELARTHRGRGADGFDHPSLTVADEPAPPLPQALALALDMDVRPPPPWEWLRMDVAWLHEMTAARDAFEEGRAEVRAEFAASIKNAEWARKAARGGLGGDPE